LPLGSLPLLEEDDGGRHCARYRFDPPLPAAGRAQKIRSRPPQHVLAANGRCGAAAATFVEQGIAIMFRAPAISVEPRDGRICVFIAADRIAAIISNCWLRSNARRGSRDAVHIELSAAVRPAHQVIK